MKVHLIDATYELFLVRVVVAVTLLSIGSVQALIVSVTTSRVNSGNTRRVRVRVRVRECVRARAPLRDTALRSAGCGVGGCVGAGAGLCFNMRTSCVAEVRRGVRCAGVCVRACVRA